MNNSNALAEIQSKYPNCNLLLPSATSVQINPFYKCSVMEVVADTAPNSGDIFSVGKVKTGEDGKGKAIYEDVFSPAKPLLMKLATAAGIQFHPEYTTVTRENTNTYVGKAYGAVRLPDGSYKTHMETKRICLDDEESKYRLEFMDKSIMGIHDWRAAKAASEMFKGEWKDDPEKINQWGKPEKYYVIADSDREKYIERSILVNMTLLRKTASEKAQTGAILRVIRALLGIKGTYSKAELEKPFVVPTVTFAPDYTDPTVRSAMLQQGMNSMGNMFGASSTPPAISTAWLIYSDTNFSRSITYVIGREAACVEEHLWMVGEALDDDEFSDYLSEYLMALIVEVANATRDQIIDNFMRFMTGGSEDGAGDM